MRIHLKFILSKKKCFIILCGLTQTCFKQGSFSARLAHREFWHDIARRWADICSFGSEQPSYIQAYRHRVFRPLQYLDGCAGPFSAAHGFRNFFCLTFATGPFRVVTAKPRCIGTAVPGVPGLARPRVRVAEFSVSCPPSNKNKARAASTRTAVLSPSSIYLDPFRFIFGLALSTVNSTESSRASLGIAGQTNGTEFGFPATVSYSTKAGFQSSWSMRLPTCFWKRTEKFS